MFIKGDTIRFNAEIRKIYPEEEDRTFLFMNYNNTTEPVISFGGRHKVEGRGITVKTLTYPDKPKRIGDIYSMYVDSMMELVQDRDNQI